MGEGQKVKVQKKDEWRWRIPREGAMRTEGLVFADEKMMKDIRMDQSLSQTKLPLNSIHTFACINRAKCDDGNHFRVGGHPFHELHQFYDEQLHTGKLSHQDAKHLLWPHQFGLKALCSRIAIGDSDYRGRLWVHGRIFQHIGPFFSHGCFDPGVRSTHRG